MYRRLGYPAPIVMGFQGRRYNQAGNYIQVRDADAHAWIEVHDGLGWQRIDPTEWIAPDRMGRGIEVFDDALGATGASRLTFDAGPVGEFARRGNYPIRLRRIKRWKPFNPLGWGGDIADRIRPH